MPVFFYSKANSVVIMTKQAMSKGRWLLFSVLIFILSTLYGVLNTHDWNADKEPYQPPKNSAIPSISQTIPDSDSGIA
jgi:hypothetical protein